MKHRRKRQLRQHLVLCAVKPGCHYGSPEMRQGYMSDYATTTLEFGAVKRQLHFREQSSDVAVFKQIFVDQQYNPQHLRRAPELVAFLERQRANGRRPLVIDAGANIGASALYFAFNLPDALIVAIEPDLENFKLLTKNVEGLNVEPIQAALASSNSGRARVVDPGLGHWGYRTQPLSGEAVAGDSIPYVAINDIFRSHGAPYFPFLVKIDIEGGEMDVFSDNTEWVARTPLLIVELHDWLLLKGGTSRPFLQCISQLDRDFIYRGEDIYSVANDFDAIVQAGG